MKSNEDFISDIISKAERIEAKQKRARNILVKSGIGALALALVLSCGFGVARNNHTATQSTAQITSELIESAEFKNESKGFSLIANCDYEPQKEINSSDKSFNVSIPMGGFLNVTDTRAMSADEINKIAYELKMQLKSIYGENCEWRINGKADEKSAVYFASAGKLKFILPENSEMESVTLRCTENGRMILFDLTQVITGQIKAGNDITVSAEEYQKMKNDNDGMIINWIPSEKLENELSEIPDTDLSTIEDTISGEVKYTDGSTESFIIKISFDTDGTLRAFYSCKSA